MNYIVCSISDDEVEFVGAEKTAYNIMKELDSMYLRESTAIQISVRNKLERMRLNDYEESSTFFIEFEKLMNELKYAGAMVSQREKVNYMLRTLPDSLSYVGDLFDSLKEADRTCEFLKNKINMWEARSKEKNGLTHTNKNALKSERQESGKVCFGCGEPGHIKANCRNRGSIQGSRGNNATERTYDQGGAHQSYQRRGGRGRGTYQRGRGTYQRGRRWQQRDEGNRRHDTEDENAGSFYAEVVKEISNSQAEVNVSENLNVEWILDSGCTDHIINNESYFTNFVCLKNPINVKVGDGRSVQATKVDNIKTYSLIYGKK